MSIFKRRRFPVEIIMVCMRWYCKYGITYRDLAEMMQAQGRRRNSTHQQAVRCCCLMCNIDKSELRVPQLCNRAS